MTATRKGTRALTFSGVVGVSSNAATARIIAAVGKQPDNLKALTDDIAKAAGTLDDMEAFKRIRSKGSRRRLSETRKALERIIKRIGDDDPLLLATGDELSRIANSLRKNETWLEHWHQRRRIPKDGRYPTPIEWLSGAVLPEVFERQFNRPATFSRDANGSPSGMVIDFVTAALNEFGVTYSTESIARAITRMR